VWIYVELSNVRRYISDETGNCERFGWMVRIFIAMCKKANLRALAESYHKMATVPTGRSRHIKGLVKSNPATMVTKQTPYSYIGPLV
jgi:hypothetical protein